MTWVRSDDKMSNNRKVAVLSDQAFRLDREAMEWSSSCGTDGRIGADEIGTISRSKTVNRILSQVVAELVRRGRWHRATDPPCPHSLLEIPTCAPPGPDGWVVHDYLDYNPTAERVRQQLKMKSERQARWRDRHSGAGRRDGDASNEPSTGPVSRTSPAPTPDATSDGAPDGLQDRPPDAAPRAPVSPTPPRPAPKEGGGGAPAATAARRGAAERADDGRAEDQNLSPPPTPPTNGPAADEARAAIRDRIAAARRGRHGQPGQDAPDPMAALRELTPEIGPLVEVPPTDPPTNPIAALLAVAPQVQAIADHSVAQALTAQAADDNTHNDEGTP